jgi:hypothetical protein
MITTALPSISHQLRSQTASVWIGSAYLLTSAAVAPVYGKVADIWGRKSALLYAIVLLGGGSAICGWSGTAPQLIAGRAVQGMGAGGIIVLVNISISDMWSARYDAHQIRSYIVFPANEKKPSRHIPGNDWPCLGGCCRTWATPRWCVHRAPFMALGVLDQPSLLFCGFRHHLLRLRHHQCKGSQRQRILGNGLDRNCRDHKHDDPRAAESRLRRCGVSLEVA